MYTLGEAVGYIRLEMGKFMQEAQQARQTTQQIESEFDKLGDVSQKIEGVITKSFVAIGAAIVAGLGKAVDVGSQFEASMSQVAATMGMTSEDIASNSADFEKLSNAAKEMGETTKFSASQAADALNYLALAGYDAEQSISTLPTVLNLAAAGGMDLARASDMITDAASALGLELDDMSLFADKMAKAAQSSNTSVEQLGDAILQIGGTARNLNGGITELNTALGILANNGIKAAEGGTALRQIVLNLTAPTEKAAKYIEELGLQVADAEGNVRPLNEIFRDLDEILQSRGITGSADKIKALAEIFDARQLKSATALLNNYGESWDRLYDKIDNAEGAASRMAETMETNLRGALTILGSTAEALGITVYESIEGSFKQAVEEATKQLKNLNDAFKSSEMKAALQKISDAISKAIVELSKFLSDVIPKLVSGFSALIDNFDKISALLAGLVTTIGLATGGMMLFKIQTDLVTQSLIAQKLATLAANAALLANPYTLVAVGVGVLVTALINLENQQKANYEQIDKVNEKYREQKQAVDEIANQYDEEIKKAEELNHSRDEEINRVNQLLGIIERNVDETGKIIKNQELVKDAIDEINSIIPLNIQYQGDQIQNYEKLVQGSKDYCKQLYNEAVLEAKKEEFKASSVAYDEAIKKREELTKNLEEAQAKFEAVRHAHEDYDADISQFQAEADAMGMLVGEYIQDLYDTSSAALENAQVAFDENERIIRESSENIKEYEDNYVKLMLDAGQEVEGVYRTQADAIIDIERKKAEEIQRINREAHQGDKENAEQIISDEEQLEKALEELEIQFNTGLIASDEEYHRRRLELLENFHGEWSKKSSGWLKSELDYEERERENALKEQQKQAEELQRQREKEQREAEQAAKEKERLFKQETQAKITEIDRRKELEENYSDEQYIADLQAVADTLDKEGDLYKDLAYKIAKYEKQITENNKKELEQQNKDAFDAIKDRKDLETGYSNKQYLEDLKNFQKTLNAESDLYKQVGKEIINVEKQIASEQQKTADTAFKSWEKGFDALKTQAEKAYDDITKKQQNLENKLNNEIELYETKTKKVKNLTTGLWEDVETKKTSTKFFKDQTKELEKYQEQLEKLSNRGVSDDLMQKILGMDEESAKEYVKALNGMSEDGLKAYDEAYQNLVNKNKEFSEKYYADEVEAFKTEWGNKIQDYIDTLPEDARKAGKETIESFITGLSEVDTDNVDFDTWFKTMTADLQNNADKGKAFENYGASAVETIDDEIKYKSDSLYQTCFDMGKQAAEKFKQGWKEITGLVDTSMINYTLPQSTLIDPTMLQMSNAYGNNMQGKQNGITEEQLRNVLKETYPDGDVILNVDGDSFAKISRKQLNGLSQKSGNLALQV